MRDGGLHYLERIVEAYDKAATEPVESYQGAETRSEGSENQYMARGQYWRPQLKQAEWELLERRMNAEIKSGENLLDEATKWVYADEKSVQVFALYGIGDGTEATPLYAVGGKRAAVLAGNMQEFINGGYYHDKGTGTALSRIRGFLRTQGDGGGDIRETSRGRSAGADDALYGGERKGNSGRTSGRGTENQRGVKDQFSIREIKGEDGTDYGKGVYLDSTLLEGLTDAERKEMMRERVKELGGQTITAYDPNGEAVDIRIAAPSEKFRNRNGRRVPVTNDLARKNRDVKVKQESVVLADELIATSQYKRPRKAKYPHGWLDNNGKNDWQYWTTYIQDKNNTVWEATLNVAESANGVKYLYDIDPIEKVGQPVKSGTSTTLVGQPVKSGTSTTGDIVAQDQTESQAQIRSSTLSDRDVLRIAAQMAKNSESMLDIKKNHPASSLFRAYNSVPAASAEWLYWQYNLCWAECQHQGLAFFLRGGGRGRAVLPARQRRSELDGGAAGLLQGQQGAGCSSSWCPRSAYRNWPASMQNGKNDWQYWMTYIQDKNNTVWEATLHIATSTNGVKHLYDISPIKKVGRARELATSTTGDIVAQNQTESQAQIRSSTLSDRDVLRIAAQMAKNSESRSLTDGDRSAPLNFGYHEAKHLIQSCFIQIETVSVLQCVLPCFLFRISILDHECRLTRKRIDPEKRSICGNEKFFPVKINRAVFCREGSFHFG